MNKRRREAIQKVLDQMLELKERVESLKDEEQEAFDSMPESLQQSDRGQASEAAASALESAVDAFDEIETALQEALA